MNIVNSMTFCHIYIFNIRQTIFQANTHAIPLHFYAGKKNKRFTSDTFRSVPWIAPFDGRNAFFVVVVVVSISGSLSTIYSNGDRNVLRWNSTIWSTRECAAFFSRHTFYGFSHVNYTACDGILYFECSFALHHFALNHSHPVCLCPSSHLYAWSLQPFFLKIDNFISKSNGCTLCSDRMNVYCRNCLKINSRSNSDQANLNDSKSIDCRIEQNWMSHWNHNNCADAHNNVRNI